MPATNAVTAPPHEPPRRRRCAAPALAGAALLALGALAPPPPAAADLLGPEHTAGVDLTDADVIREGGERFNGLCAGYCHGTGGTAKRGPALRNRPELHETALYATILNGRKRGGNPMPGWKGLLTDEEIWTIIAYIVSLRDAPPAHTPAPAGTEDNAAH